MFFDESKVDIIKCKIEWKLCNLKKLVEYANNDQFFTSKQFFNPKCPSVIWEMRVYPSTMTFRQGLRRNFDLEYQNFESKLPGSGVSIISKGILNSAIKVKYNIYAIDVHRRHEYISSGFENFINQTETCKYYIDVNRLIHADDFLLLYCEVEFVPFGIECVENIIDDSGTTNQKSLSNMYKQGILTDCVIKIGNEKINAHRCVLANNSIVFKRMFEQENMTEAKNGEINIIDSSPECFRLMLDYFYNCEINKNTLEKLVYDLFAIAHKYEVKSLMDKCEYIMATKINATNYSEQLSYLQLYNLPILEKACVKYISANRKTFLNSNEWKNLKENNKDKANNLLESVLKNEF